MVPALQIGLTLDDLPVHGTLPPETTWQSIHMQLVQAIQGCGLPAVIGFINGVNLKTDDQKAALLAWLRGGQKIGNHTYSHRRPHEIGADSFLQDIFLNEKVLELMYPLVRVPQRKRIFRYPCLDEGGTPQVKRHIGDQLMAENFSALPVHISFHDWRWNEYYLQCVKREDEIACRHVEDLFIAWSRRTVAHYMTGGLQRNSSFVYVIALHVGAMEARVLARWLRALQGDGVEFVDAERALEQPTADEQQLESARRAPDMPFEWLDEIVSLAGQRRPRTQKARPSARALKMQ